MLGTRDAGGQGRQGPRCCVVRAQSRADFGAWSPLGPGWAPAARPWVKSSNLHLKRGEPLSSWDVSNLLETFLFTAELVSFRRGSRARVCCVFPAACRALQKPWVTPSSSPVVTGVFSVDCSTPLLMASGSLCYRLECGLDGDEETPGFRRFPLRSDGKGRLCNLLGARATAAPHWGEMGFVTDLWLG